MSELAYFPHAELGNLRYLKIAWSTYGGLKGNHRAHRAKRDFLIDMHMFVVLNVSGLDAGFKYF